MTTVQVEAQNFWKKSVNRLCQKIRQQNNPITSLKCNLSPATFVIMLICYSNASHSNLHFFQTYSKRISYFKRFFQNFTSSKRNFILQKTMTLPTNERTCESSFMEGVLDPNVCILHQTIIIKNELMYIKNTASFESAKLWGFDNNV